MESNKHKYRVKKKGVNVVLEELKERMQPMDTKIKRYDQRIEQYRINRLFQQDQRRLYQQLNRKKKAAKILTQKKVGYFGATFEEQKRVTTKMLNG